VSISVVKCSWVKCGEVFQCSDGPSNKGILLLADSFIFFRFYFYQYMVVLLFNTVMYVFLLLGLCILIVQLP
jgi:hypothetical protein